MIPRAGSNPAAAIDCHRHPIESEYSTPCFGATALDGGAIDEWVACFVSDAQYSVRSRASVNPMYEVRGAQALREYRESHPVIQAGAGWQHQVSTLKDSSRR